MLPMDFRSNPWVFSESYNVSYDVKCDNEYKVCIRCCNKSKDST